MVDQMSFLDFPNSRKKVLQFYFKWVKFYIEKRKEKTGYTWIYLYKNMMIATVIWYSRWYRFFSEKNSSFHQVSQFLKSHCQIPPGKSDW